MSTQNVAGKPGLDPTLPDVELTLGGKAYHLAFDFNAIVMAEKATGTNLLSALVTDINATNLRGLLWAALLKENPKLTIDEVGAMITPAKMGTINNAIVTAWFGSVKDDSEQGEAPAQ